MKGKGFVNNTAINNRRSVFLPELGKIYGARAEQPRNTITEGQD